MNRAEADVGLNRNELAILRQALNEVCGGLDIREFSTRMGAERTEVDELLSRLKVISDSSKPRRKPNPALVITRDSKADASSWSGLSARGPYAKTLPALHRERLSFR